MTTQVNAKIQDKEYIIACPEEERDKLLQSVEYLNMKIDEIKNSGNIIGAERVAVMAALNIATELLNHQSENTQYSQEVGSTLQRLTDKINAALSHGNQMDMVLDNN